MLVEATSIRVLKECQFEGMLVEATSIRVLKECRFEGMLVDATSSRRVKSVPSRFEFWNEDVIHLTGNF